MVISPSFRDDSALSGSGLSEIGYSNEFGAL